MGGSKDDTMPSPEIKKMVKNMTPLMTNATSQQKYEAVIERKRYDHNCFLECVLMRLDIHRGTQTSSHVQEQADKTFTHMLQHAL